MIHRFRFAGILVLCTLTLLVPPNISAYHEGLPGYHPIEHDQFLRVWERTDLPVTQAGVARSWIWGPLGFSDHLVEEYDEAVAGIREVQYFDKSRMEVPPHAMSEPEAADSPWAVTQGLLARELMTGKLQLGDLRFEQYTPSRRSAAGDPGDTSAPTYEVMGQQVERPPRAGNQVIVEHIRRNGEITTDPDRFSQFQVIDVTDTYGTVEGIDKNIASVFWEFMTSHGLVYESGELVMDRPIFLNAFYAVGYPLTDAFWADVTVSGNSRTVLIQCFERRCLTYTPGNPEGWEVESGNIGQHYYLWRHVGVPAERTEGTFTFAGESSATLAVGETIILTAHVVRDGEPVEGIELDFTLSEEDERAISVQVMDQSTNADGVALVAVTGVAEGTAVSRAKFTIDRSPPETPPDEVEVDLGAVAITVVPSEDPD